MKTTITNTAKQIGISQGFLSLILRNRRTPSWATAKRLEAATGISAVDWIEGRVSQSLLKSHLKSGQVQSPTAESRNPFLNQVNDQEAA